MLQENRFDINLTINKKINYDNLFNIIINQHSYLKQYKYDIIWKNINLKSIRLSIDNNLFNNKIFSEITYSEYIAKITDSFSRILDHIPPLTVKYQLLQLYSEKLGNIFMTFYDYVNIIAILITDNEELINFIKTNKELNMTNFPTLIENLSFNDLVSFLKEHAIIERVNFADLLSKYSFVDISTKLPLYSLIVALTNIFLFNLFYYTKVLIFYEYLDILNYFKYNNIYNFISVDELITLNFNNLTIIDETDILLRFYEQQSFVLNILNRVTKDEDKSYQNFINDKLYTIIYLYQVLSIIYNTSFQQTQYILNNIFKDYITRKPSDNQMLFLEYYLDETFINNHYINDEQTIKNIKNRLYDVYNNIIKNIFSLDVKNFLKQELSYMFFYFCTPYIYNEFNTSLYVYQFYKKLFNVFYKQTQNSLKYNPFLDYKINIFEENLFGELSLSKTFYDLYLKYYFMSVYIISDKLYIDLINVIDDEYFYNDQDLLKNYIINLLSHVVTQIYMISTMLKNINKYEFIQPYYLEQLQKRYFVEDIIKVSPTFQQDFNRFLVQFIIKYQNYKGTQFLINKILKFLSLLTKDLQVMSGLDYIQTTKKFDNVNDDEMFPNSPTYSTRLNLKLLEQTTEQVTKKDKNFQIYNLDISNFYDLVSFFKNNKQINLRKYIFSSKNKITVRNTLYLKSRFYKDIDTERLLKSNLTVLQNFNEIMESILLFTKLLLTFLPIYYNIYLDQIVSSSEFTKSNIVYLFEIIFSYQLKNVANENKIYFTNMYYPHISNTFYTYIRNLNRLNDNNEIYNQRIKNTPMYTKKYNYVSFLSNATLQKLLKLYVEQTNLFENYHYNLSIQYYFLPTNLININTNSSELNDLITQINLLINNSVRIKYLINDIKNSTAYKPVNQFFEDSFYENDNKYRTLNIVSNNFELFSDLAISHKTVKKNIFSEYDAIIHKFDYTKINTPDYNLRMKYIVTNSYNILRARCKNWQNDIYERFFFSNAILIKSISNIINNIYSYSREELLVLGHQYLSNFLGPYTEKFNEYTQTFFDLVLTQEYSEIQDFFRQLVNLNLQMYTETKTKKQIGSQQTQYTVDFETYVSDKNLDRMLLALNEYFIHNTNFYQIYFDLFLYENYRLLSNKDNYYNNIFYTYTDQRLNINSLSKYSFLYGHYRPTTFNKVFRYEYFTNKSHHPHNYPKYNININTCVYRDIIESYETLQFDLSQTQIDNTYGFGEFESKPLFEVSKYFITINTSHQTIDTIDNNIISYINNRI